MKFAEEIFAIMEDDPRGNQKELISFLYHTLEMFKLNEPIPEISLLGFTFTIDLKMRTLSLSEMENLGFEAESFDEVAGTLNSLKEPMRFERIVNGEVSTEVLNVFSKTSVNLKKEEIGFKFSDEFIRFYSQQE